MKGHIVKTDLRAAFTLGLAALFLAAAPAAAQERARDLGVPFDGTPGEFNAITDVPGVEVGQTTVIKGEGPLDIGRGPARTGVTIIHPLGKDSVDGVAAGRAVINGTGEWTGMHLVDEIGLFFGPVALTGSGNVGLVIQSLMDWSVEHVPAPLLVTRVLPVVGETLDSRLNDVFGHPLSREDVFAALDSAASGPVAEGNVGGGTGMIAYTFKGGVGTASRIVEVGGKRYTVGVLLQANHGNRDDLRIAGIPVGREIEQNWPEINGVAAIGPNAGEPQDKNSLLIVIATDAPLMPHQLRRVARRAAMGVGRNGSTAGNLSGEMVLAFSTTNVSTPGGEIHIDGMIADTDSDTMNALFAAVVQATEEALVNQLVASETMTGANGVKVYALPRDQLVEILARHNRLVPQD
ncbi:DmpA family aminopeptidase [Stakelama tenebrarum]|uniref:P1 family peptidase n=1 Tax=Stakelama tenebrarum TaxID=2711215 RepID=A0A6G6Y395_9SPHN|nr:P1 family peptidase [Sphingosinithalassobacter tenebrarum]QIG79370.1 P1 family peptidase [Sphingosinithalassobacter tenebrarum]